MLKERMFLAESGKDEEVAKKVETKYWKSMQTIQLFVPQGKEQGNLFFQKGKNNDALKQYNG